MIEAQKYKKAWGSVVKRSNKIGRAAQYPQSEATQYPQSEASGE